MLWKVILLEKDKMLRSTTWRVEIIILVALIALVDLGQYTIISAFQSNRLLLLAKSFTWPNSIQNAAQFAESHSIGGVILVVLIGALTAREYSWRTFHLWLSRGVPRSTLLGAKFILGIVSAVLTVCISFIVSGVITGILTIVVYGSLNIQQINLQMMFLNCVVIGYGLLPYIALTFMIALVTRSAVAAIGVGLTFILIVETTLYTVLTLVGGNAANIAQYLPIGLESSMSNAVAGNTTTNVIHINFASPAVAVVCIALYILLFAGIGAWSFMRQNFTD